MNGKLFVVGTPIGNLEDFSPRAVRVLSEVDFIAAEDTRVTLKLLNHFGIKKPMISYFEHNKNTRTEEIINRLSGGCSAAIVTDAGMPAISDPGEDLVKAAYENGIAVESVPGPTALTTALALSGMHTKHFWFEGFLPTEKKERKERLCALSAINGTLVLYEAPHRLQKTLTELLEALGDRQAAVCKEITKIHESVNRMALSRAAEYYKANEPRGEFVIIIEGAAKQTEEHTLGSAVKMANDFVNKGLKPSIAAKQAAEITGIKKSEIYKELIS